MKPLLYLTSRSIVNGVRRSFQSPIRALATVMFIAMQLWWLSRVFFGVSDVRGASPFMPPVGHDATEVLVTLGFCFFAFVCWTSFFGLFQPPMVFQLAEVDVLVPTPVSARVYLMYNFLKGYVARLLWPLFMLFFAARPFARITRNGGLDHMDFAALSSAFKTATLAYLLMQFAWAAWRYATGLMFSESTARAIKIRTVVTWSITIACFGYFALIGYRIAMAIKSEDVEVGLLALARAPDVLFVFFPATAAIKLGTLPITGDTGSALGGLAVLLVTAATGFGIMMARAPKVYEIASRMAVARAELRQRRVNESQGLISLSRARTGKMKAREFGALSSLRLTGDAAFWWKEVVILARSTGGILLTVLLVPAGYGYVAHFVNSIGKGDSPAMVVIPASLLLFGPMIVSGQAQNGFRDFLKKGDLLRPLPLKPGRLLFVEAFSKVVPTVLVGFVSLVVMSAFLPVLWPTVVPTFVTLAVVSCFASVATLYLQVLLPDMTDPAQNMFRRMVQGLGLTVVIYGSAFGYGALAFFNVFVAAAVVVPVAAGLTGLCLYGAGRSYRTFNPAD
ncbi:MAG: hypothetical protein JSS65_03780 [Armatimonadetes bacterium]|nr:hypothetical protein [Armatimonadota bacterium]